MALLGANGVVTSFPNTGEKLCVACEYWTGRRELTNNGNSATSVNGEPAMCECKRDRVYPQRPCSCPSSKFVKWHLIR